MSIQKPTYTEARLRQLVANLLTESVDQAKMNLSKANDSKDEIQMDNAELALFDAGEALAYVKKVWGV